MTGINNGVGSRTTDRSNLSDRGEQQAAYSRSAPTVLDLVSDDMYGPAYSRSNLDQLSRQPTTLERLRDQTSGTELLTSRTVESSRVPVQSAWHGSETSTSNAIVAMEVGSVDRPTATRMEEIDAWLAEHALERDFLDAAGGEAVADAFNDASTLGELTNEETRYLATQALSIWREDGNTENVQEAADGLVSAETREVVATVFSQASVQRFDSANMTGGPPAGLSRIGQTALQTAINLDAAAVIRSHESHEGVFGSVLGDMQGYNGRQLRESILEAVANQFVNITDDNVSQMVTAIFLKSPPLEFVNNEYRQASSAALAAVMVNPDDFIAVPQATYQRQLELVSQRFNDVLASNDGRQLISDGSIPPQLRGWAVANIAANPAFNAENLRGGWQSETISQAFATPVMQQYLARGTKPEILRGEVLRNSIGQALGVVPDRLPVAGETPSQEQARLAEGFDHQYYGPDARIDAIATRITELGGNNARVTIMPVVVTSNEFGAASFNVFKVESETGTHIIEDVDPTRSYSGFDDWRDNSRLPPGKMTYAEGLDWNSGNASLVTENTAEVTDSFGEWVRKIGDSAALVVGVGVGIALVVGSGGTALLVAGAGAGLYTAGRAGEELLDAHSHGQDISDLSDAEIRSLWLDAAAGTLSFGAMGAARGATKLISTGSRIAPAAASTAAGLQLTANVADFAAGSNQAITLGANWQDLSAGERALGLLNVAFWGGMTAASTRAGGGSLADTYSFTRLRNNIEFGIPYPLVRNDDLQNGQIRVSYDMGSNGRASSIRIEHGGGVADSALVDLHVQSARQMQASGGLLDRLRATLGSDQPLAIGSAGWEARFEIAKIEGEQALVQRALSEPTINATELQSLERRLVELDAAIVQQQARLDHLETQGQGWVASPSGGSQQAGELSWPEAPRGYTWVAGADEPHLRRTDTDGERLFYDPTTGNFRDTTSVRDMQRVGHGSNEVTWTTSPDGDTVQVVGSVREFYRYAERSTDELSAQSQVRDTGLPGDHAGHILGHRFVLDQGLKNLFPQDANFNTSAYKTFENEMADWVAAGADVNVDIRVSGFNDERPDLVVITYNVTHPDADRPLWGETMVFDNDAAQTYNRVSPDVIRALTDDLESQ